MNNFEFNGSTRKELLDLGVYELSSIVTINIPSHMRNEDTPLDQSLDLIFIADIDGVIEFALSGISTVYDGDIPDLLPQTLNVIQANYDELIEAAKRAHKDALLKT